MRDLEKTIASLFPSAEIPGRLFLLPSILKDMGERFILEYEEDKMTPLSVQEVSLRSLIYKLLQKPFGVISGFSVLDRDITVSTGNTRKLKRELKAKGYETIYIGGAWMDTQMNAIIPEMSLLVVGREGEEKKLLKDLTYLAKKFNQFAFIFGDGEDIVLYSRSDLERNSFKPERKFTGYEVLTLRKAIELMHNKAIEGISFYRTKAVLGKDRAPGLSDLRKLFKKYGRAGLRPEDVERLFTLEPLFEGSVQYRFLGVFRVGRARGWMKETYGKTPSELLLSRVF